MKHNFREMVENDIPIITTKFNQYCNIYQKDIFTYVYFQEAYFADSQGSVVIEGDSSEILGFAFTGIKHPRDILHDIEVGYIGYNALPPIIFNIENDGIYSELWSYCIKILRQRNVNIIRFIIAGETSLEKINPEIIRNIRKFNFKKKIVDNKLNNIVNGDVYYIILSLKIKNRKKEIKYHIRYLHKSEIPILIKLYDENFDPLETHCNADEIRAKIRINNNSIIVAEINGKIMGSVFAPIYGEISELQGLVVNKEFRGRGIGKDLTKSAINHFLDKKVTRVIAGVSANDYFTYKLLSDLGFNIVSGSTWFFYKKI